MSEIDWTGAVTIVPERNGYRIVKTRDGKIYNIQDNVIKYVRDPSKARFEEGQTVLVKKLGEYAEVVEVKMDEEWGNHRYDVHFFNTGMHNSHYLDQTELEEVK